MTPNRQPVSTRLSSALAGGIGVLLLAVAWVTAFPAFAQPSGHTPRQLEGTGIDEHLGNSIPLDLVFRNESGQEVTLGSYFDGERPVLLALVYHNCPMLCDLVLHGLTQSMSQMAWVPGKQFDVLAVSFNPRETPEIAREEKEKYLRMLGNPDAAGGFHFLTGDEDAIAALTASVGFKYRWIEEQQEYAHPSSLIFLSGHGRISRYLYGIEFRPRIVRTALVEASNGKIGSTMDQVILYCFQFDPNANSYVLHAMNLMKLGGLLTVVLLGALLLLTWKREKRRDDGLMVPSGEPTG